MIQQKLLILIPAVLLAVAKYAPGATYTLSVNLSSTMRPVTHCASGSLYGITETLPGDISGLLAPLKPNVFTQPARAGTGRQQPIGAAIPVSERIASSTGKVMIRLADICPGWPYNWPGQSKWLSEVTSVINDKKASGRNNYDGYEIWNEPNGTWLGNNGDFNTVCWKPTYDLIRSKDSDAKIIGPSDAYYVESRINDFLTYCKNNNCLPDVICWHELQGCANISTHVNNYRALENKLSISAREISINEYCHNTHEYEGCPGTSAPFIAKFERNKVSSACYSWWFTNLPGRLGSLLTSSNQKGGGWWFYKWYGDMTGDMVSVTPPDDNSEGIDGFACLDTNYASVCLGGNSTGTVNVVIKGIPSTFGSSVNAKVEFVSWTNKDTPVSGPTTLSTTPYAVSDGTITVPVNVTSQFYGYRVYITHGSIVEIGHYKSAVPASKQINMYTDAARHLMTISLPGNHESNADIYIFSSTGQLLKKECLSGEPWIINIHELASGLYITKIKYDNQLFLLKFIMK